MDRPKESDDRQARLAEALRANLRRRKAAGRREGANATPPAGEDAPATSPSGEDEGA